VKPLAPAYLVKEGASGLGKRPSDNAFWLPGVPDNYIELLMRSIRARDLRPLLALLQVRETVRRHFQDLFERLEFKTRKSRRADAAKRYNRTAKQIRPLLATRRPFIARIIGVVVGDLRLGCRRRLFSPLLDEPSLFQSGTFRSSLILVSISRNNKAGRRHGRRRVLSGRNSAANLGRCGLRCFDPVCLAK
jgi:hypothetical protein